MKVGRSEDMKVGRSEDLKVGRSEDMRSEDLRGYARGLLLAEGVWSC
jgi:hypothetical protein